jgi:hypothetical protein
MTLRIATVLFLCMAAAGCSAGQPQAPNEAKIPVPSFQIRLTLSDAAAKKLRDAGESIKGFVIFDGDGTPKTHEDSTGGGRAVGLGTYWFERTGAGVVSVTNAAISDEAFKRLSDTNYYYTINIFSGRRVFKDNILDGGYAGGHISDAVNAPLEIKCDLIEKPPNKSLQATRDCRSSSAIAEDIISPACLSSGR